MRELKHVALFLALALGNVVVALEDVVQAQIPGEIAIVPNPQSLYIQFMHPTPRVYGYGQDLGFRLDVNPSSFTTGGTCASPNITINSQPLLASQDGSFVLDNDIKVDLTWESRCFPSVDVDDIDVDADSASTAESVLSNPSSNDNVGHEEFAQISQSVTLNLKTVDGQPVKEDLSCTIWFSQEEPIWAFGVAGWCVDARIRDVRGKNGGWEVVSDDDDATHDGNALGEEGEKRESREMRLMRERKEFEKEVECLEYRRSVAADQEEGGQVGGHGHGHGYAQKPFVSREYEASQQRLEALCANFAPRANNIGTLSVHPPWQLPLHRPAKPARLPFPGLLLDSPSPSSQQRTLASIYASLSASIHAHLTNLSPARIVAYLIFLSLPIFACVFHFLRRLCKRRKRLNQHNGGGEPVVIESLCPGFYGSDESCGECKTRYLAQLQAEACAGLGSDGECKGDHEVGEKTSEEQGEGEVLEEKEPMPAAEEEKWEKEEKERLSERQYQQYCDFHAVPEDEFALRYEPGSEVQSVHEPVDQIFVDGDDARAWDEKETLVDSEDEREKELREVGESSSGAESGGEDSDDDLSIGGELASFMRAANLVEDMIRAGARRETVPRPEIVPPVNARRQPHLSATSPPPSYREVVRLRGVGDDEGLPPRYEEYLRSRR